MDFFICLLLIIQFFQFTHGDLPPYRRQRPNDRLLLQDLIHDGSGGSDDFSNDIHRLSFSSDRFNFSVPANAEPGYTIGRLTIIEDSSRDYSQVIFHLRAKNDGVSKDYFHLESKTGVLRVSQSGINVQETHVFIVTATDQSSPTSPMAVAVLTIDVMTDGNFYTPVFDKMRYRASVGFDVNKGTTVLTVRATDSDNGENGMVAYRLVNPAHRNNIFRCKRNGEIANRKVFGVDRIGSYTLIVEGFDGGNPPKKSTTKVKISVYDVRPRFLKTNYTIKISDSTPLGSRIGVVVATSWQTTDHNANISYSVIHGGDYFAINQSNGVIRLIGNIDYDIFSYRLLVRAQQTGYALRTKDTVVTVNVDRPVVQKREDGFNISIPEDIPIGSQIHKFDYNMDVTSYKMMNSSTDLPFRVDQKTGTVYTTSDLDRELTNLYTFKIQVEEGKVPYTVDMRILIKDINDNKPIFQNCQNKIELQETTVGTEVIRIVVSDADFPSQFLYSIKFGNTDNVFKTVKYKNGVSVVVAKEIQLRQYDITLVASDTVYESVCNISMLIVNKNTPLFERWIYNELVYEEQQIGKRVLQVRATDRDVGENGHVTYSVRYNPYFTIDQSTGEIFTTRTLDRESNDYHVFNVTATDGGDPPKQSWATVNIYVLDVNDNRPRFLNLAYFGQIEENTNSSVPIVQVKAVDDDNHTSAITYGLKEDGLYSYFDIDKQTGLVRTRQGYDLDRELVSEIHLIATASDGLHMTLASIIITVIDVDDNPPRIISPTQYEIQGNIGVGEVVGHVIVSDADEDIRSPVEFLLTKQDSKFFSINSTTGVLSTKRNLRHRNKNVYDRLDVVVTSGNYTIREALVIYIIRNETIVTPSPLEITEDIQTTSQSTVLYTLNASIPLQDESPDIQTSVAPMTSIETALENEYNATSQQTTEESSQTTQDTWSFSTAVPILDPATSSSKSMTFPIFDPTTSSKSMTLPNTTLHSTKTIRSGESPKCSCDSYDEDQRQLTMRILKTKLETQETELRVRQMERRVTNMRLRYWSQQLKIVEDREIKCGEMRLPAIDEMEGK